MPSWKEILSAELDDIRAKGLEKVERYIHSAQGAEIVCEFPEGAEPRRVLNFCANNYLGLSSHPAVVEAARQALDSHGYGMSSVRFICGTQDIHRQLEKKTADFLGTEDTILFSSCMDANAAVFEFLGPADVIIADRLVHASLIDGIRLSKAKNDNFKHSNMEHLKQKLEQYRADGARIIVVVVDGIFSMDGDVAPLDEIVKLCKEHDALSLVDDSHASGFMGMRGRGSHEAKGVFGEIDIITTTFGKALGGASGGCVSGRQEIIDYLRQRGRPYLFSNSMAPPIVAASLKVLDLLTSDTSLRDQLEENYTYFRAGLERLGFDVKPGHAIAPVMLYNAKLAQDFARDMYDEGIYVIGFCFPVVPMGQARIRTQLSAAHTREHLDQALAAFEKIGTKYEIRGLKKKQILAKYPEAR